MVEEARTKSQIRLQASMGNGSGVLVAAAAAAAMTQNAFSQKCHNVIHNQIHQIRRQHHDKPLGANHQRQRNNFECTSNLYPPSFWAMLVGKSLFCDDSFPLRFLERRFPVDWTSDSASLLHCCLIAIAALLLQLLQQ